MITQEQIKLTERILTGLIALTFTAQMIPGLMAWYEGLAVSFYYFIAQ